MVKVNGLKLSQKGCTLKVPTLQEDKRYYAKINQLVADFVPKMHGVESPAWASHPGKGAALIRDPEFKRIGRNQFTLPTPNGCWTSFHPVYWPNADRYFCVTPEKTWECVASYHEYPGNGVEEPYRWSISSRSFSRSEVRWHPIEEGYAGITVEKVYTDMRYRLHAWLKGGP